MEQIIQEVLATITEAYTEEGKFRPEGLSIAEKSIVTELTKTITDAQVINDSAVTGGVKPLTIPKLNRNVVMENVDENNKNAESENKVIADNISELENAEGNKENVVEEFNKVDVLTDEMTNSDISSEVKSNEEVSDDSKDNEEVSDEFVFDESKDNEEVSDEVVFDESKDNEEVSDEFVFDESKDDEEVPDEFVFDESKDNEEVPDEDNTSEDVSDEANTSEGVLDEDNTSEDVSNEYISNEEVSGEDMLSEELSNVVTADMTEEEKEDINNSVDLNKNDTESDSLTDKGEVNIMGVNTNAVESLLENMGISADMLNDITPEQQAALRSLFVKQGDAFDKRQRRILNKAKENGIELESYVSPDMSLEEIVFISEVLAAGADVEVFKGVTDINTGMYALDIVRDGFFGDAVRTVIVDGLVKGTINIAIVEAFKNYDNFSIDLANVLCNFKSVTELKVFVELLLPLFNNDVQQAISEVGTDLIDMQLYIDVRNRVAKRDYFVVAVDNMYKLISD